MTEYSISQNNSTLRKRTYVMYPLCTGYHGADYCANHQQWVGIYASDELSAQIDKIVRNDETGGWVVGYHKLYTIEQDGTSEDWQLSFRFYYANAVLSTFHWTQCDTGS